ncbi:MAG: methyltransferase domain-containing protein [Kofleriaceae bacterium]
MLDGLRCPTCKGELGTSPRQLTCTGCRRIYPRLAYGIPVMLDDAATHVADTAIRIAQARRAEAALDQRMRTLIAANHRRSPALKRQVAATELLIRLLDRWLESLAISGVTPGPGAPTGTRVFGSFPGPLLLRDWSGRAMSEASNTAMADAIARRVKNAGRERVLVVGAGMGRLAWELTRRFRDVVALDVSIPMALTFAYLGEAPIDLCDGVVFNLPDVASIGTRERCRIPEDATADAARVTYVVGDALATPLADASVDAVVCVYVLDVVRLAPLIDEIKRVLRPSGVFANLGTFGYDPRHVPVEEMWTAEEVKALLDDAGLPVAEEEWVEHVLAPSHGLAQSHLRAWSCAAINGGTRPTP